MSTTIFNYFDKKLAANFSPLRVINVLARSNKHANMITIGIYHAKLVKRFRAILSCFEALLSVIHS